MEVTKKPAKFGVQTRSRLEEAGDWLCPSGFQRFGENHPIDSQACFFDEWLFQVPGMDNMHLELQ